MILDSISLPLKCVVFVSVVILKFNIRISSRNLTNGIQLVLCKKIVF